MGGVQVAEKPKSSRLTFQGDICKLPLNPPFQRSPLPGMFMSQSAFLASHDFTWCCSRNLIFHEYFSRWHPDDELKMRKKNFLDKSRILKKQKKKKHQSQNSEIPLHARNDVLRPSSYNMNFSSSPNIGIGVKIPQKQNSNDQAILIIEARYMMVLQRSKNSFSFSPS